MTLLDGKTLSTKIKEDLKIQSKACKEKGVEPCLAVILVGNDSASHTYVNAKAKACEFCDIKSLVYKLDEKTTQRELLALINTLNYDDSVHGILVQLPLPSHINKNLILESIASSKDVDGFHPINVGYLNLGIESGFLPCTPLGVMKLLKAYDISLEGKDVVVVGASNIVGRPMATLLLNANASVSICHIKTRDLSLYTKNADIIIMAAGCPKLLKEDMIKDGVVIVDVGINRVNDKLIGDVDFENVSKKASFISPVPGGVGPMTIAMLLENTIKSAKNIAFNEVGLK
ncbi:MULTISPECIES: bifunctional methylenetetrahydrofolate dehydrogenase/methenyltetrahydrofolate cyclohydrolase FolD [unclassified Campylobacter]|uniref:bifunctional methylenetetrahydrofolate dehydrogenase/methenyltetrahydrofolate cyclohydrolase FolD n=1 Tax=unclassified Campylobacter TaxID=2593542 RepID=UPI001237C39E|nr:MULTISPECIES: bifunctional methylenetetrahydrofolate dehydrogenase/methenyltetrahydrofolate cyclohydrolase FolD [unclassified Campylobacter]KAA6225338.1 bifunctional methylenetetrahydrofolate dehydrogenase/methenyltetrahydrofolate cyclohydrolase FolD [Campylobacter sp. LR185c]KAA6227034.1 bifunctional methylenetetrahydrofolate dehydrogenase/methenyltetrahydrofolate cyclohydrolase FolD [Campylobacter sp. LR196d]KAA6227605.1 bifunctional methylenetetrahydrofolate dehydrogenase/methenyltetrahydr